MVQAYVVAVDGLEELKSFDEIPANVLKNARMAINRTAQRARAQAAREMRKQVNFPARYLSGSDGRLKIITKASGKNLEAVIRGRERPTSLARFATNRDPAAARRRGSVTVEVKPGSRLEMKGAFLMRLKAGKGPIDTNANLGLALRLRPGETIRNKRRMVQIDSNLYLLYGPSVAQVFRSVSGEISGETFDFLENEFRRLMEIELA